MRSQGEDYQSKTLLQVFSISVVIAAVTRIPSRYRFQYSQRQRRAGQMGGSFCRGCGLPGLAQKQLAYGGASQFLRLAFCQA